VACTQKYSENIIKHAWFGKIAATYCSNHWYGTVTTSFSEILVTILSGEKLLSGSSCTVPLKCIMLQITVLVCVKEWDVKGLVNTIKTVIIVG
jgi:hypothetical protein